MKNRRLKCVLDADFNNTTFQTVATIGRPLPRFYYKTDHSTGIRQAWLRWLSHTNNAERKTLNAERGKQTIDFCWFGSMAERKCLYFQALSVKH